MQKIFSKVFGNTMRSNPATRTVILTGKTAIDFAHYASGDISGSDFAKNTAANVAGLGGGYAGASTGAAIGSILLPGIGTAIGGLLGGYLGQKAASNGVKSMLD